MHPEPFSKEEKAMILERLAYSEKFESILGIRFASAKRFGLEGEALPHHFTTSPLRDYRLLRYLARILTAQCYN